jgi:hypothetical protein
MNKKEEACESITKALDCLLPKNKFKVGDRVVCMKHFSYGKDPQVKEICIISDIDGDEIYLEGYKNFYPAKYFIEFPGVVR